MHRTVDSIPLHRLEIVDVDDYARNGYPFAAWERLRREAPVYWCEHADFGPFWAVTRYHDVVDVMKRSSEFLNDRELATLQQKALGRQLLMLDQPVHRFYRRVLSERFTLRSIQQLVPEIERIVRAGLDRLATHDGPMETDAVESIAVPIPVAVVARLMDLPKADEPLIRGWSDRILGYLDPELTAGLSPDESRADARRGIREYFTALVRDRRGGSGDDLVSVLANATVDGKPLPAADLLAMCTLMALAGTQTTRDAISGGILAFLEHPEQLQKLRRDPSLLPNAVEEILRWTAPVTQQRRRAAADTEIHGRMIRKGEQLALFIPSANRDDAVFDQPDTFFISRHPNPHLTFGIGTHFCLGAELARTELTVVFGQLSSRLRAIHAAGPVARLRSSRFGSLKRLPVRYRLAATESTTL